nr:leucine-rich repeat protein 1-like [Physcomitrium patens]|eukprot:XP_024390502.1 leucine-rich repeat protein 1-like [Physcomitrella patens]
MTIFGHQGLVAVHVHGDLEVDVETHLPRLGDITPPARWEGIQCTDSGHVDSISVKNLAGDVISPSLGRLQFVRIIDLESGKLRGQIPPELANCSRLETLNLMNNELSEGLPGELGNLTALSKLLVSRNKLGGEIPRSIAASPSLSIFNLSAN